MVNIVEDFLAPLTRHIRAATGIVELGSLVPEDGINPVLGPPSLVLNSEGELVPYEGPSNLWVFRDFAADGSPSAHVEGSGSCAITLSQGTPWNQKAQGKTVEYPSVDVYYHCDVTRDSNIGAPLKFDARDKCLTLHKYLTRVLHMRERGKDGFSLWGAKADGSGALKVVTSYESMGLSIKPIYDGDGMVLGHATFDLQILL